MEIKEAIILAGGLGTRLRSAVPDLPKCMAPVEGRPFLSYLVNYYKQQGISKFIFALGYRHEMVAAWLKENYADLPMEFSIEREPLGTGGAVQLAMGKAKEQDVLILNGDTFFQVSLPALQQVHQQHSSACSISLKPMVDFDRYGIVEMDDDGRIMDFKEKQHYAEGLINGGVYLLNSPRFRQQQRPSVFSFEKDYLERYYYAMPMYGLVQKGYFIDIGIPEDYARAQAELPALLNTEQ